MPLTFVDLFAGIGGFSLGLERAGMRCIAQVEIDPYCQRVLAKHWPDVPKFGDIRTVKGSDLGSPDCIVGGFPCVNISSLGDRAGVEDIEDGSGLWREMWRLVCEIRPRLVLLENVAEITIQGLDAVLGDLAEGGYFTAWQCVPAGAVGAGHIRDRLFALGVDRDSISQHVNPLKAFSTGDPTGPSRSRAESWRQAESRMDRIADGIPNRVDRLRGLGNAVVPQVAELIGRAIVAAHKEQQPTTGKDS